MAAGQAWCNITPPVEELEPSGRDGDTECLIKHTDAGLTDCSSTYQSALSSSVMTRLHFSLPVFVPVCLLSENMIRIPFPLICPYC